MSAPPPPKQESIWESTPDVAADEEAVPPPRQSVVLATSGEPAPVADMSHMMMRPRSPPARYDRPSMPERPADTYGERRGPPPARAPSPYDERDRKRRRSPSPYGREPYRPNGRDGFRDYDRGRPPYDARREDPRREDPYYRPDEYGSRHDRGGAPPARVPVPEDLPYQVSFDHFEAYMRQSYPNIYEDRVRLDEAWRKYRNGFMRRQYSTFFEQHKKSPWFQERYDPAQEPLRARLRAKGREGKVDVFLQELSSGKFEDLDFDHQPVKAPKREELPKREDSATETSPETVAKPLDPEAQPIRTEEDPANGDAPASEKPSASVEPSEQPKTENDAKPEAEADKQKPRARDDEVAIPGSDTQLIIKAVSHEISRPDLEAHLAQVEGFDYVALSEPNPNKRFHRVGFVQFVPGSDMEAAESKLFESKIDSFTLHMGRGNQTSYQKIRTVPSPFGGFTRLEKDIEQATSLTAKLEAESGDTRGSAAIMRKVEELRASPEDGIVVLRKHMDLLLQYLRQCFATCYYCTAVHDFPEELARRCVKHVRRQAYPDDSRSRNSKANETAFVRSFDDRVAMLINPNLDPREHGGESFEAELHRQCESKIKIEDDVKFRCKACNKLFKALNFVEKHVANKHPEEIQFEDLDRIKYFNNYVLDPQRINPVMPTPHAESAAPSREAPAPYMQSHMPPPMGYPIGGYGAMGMGMMGMMGMGGQSGFAAPMSYMPGMSPSMAFPQRFDSGPSYGEKRLRDRIGERVYDDPAPKRARMAPAPPLKIPEGVREDPRKARVASYSDLDKAAATGDLDLDY